MKAIPEDAKYPWKNIVLKNNTINTQNKGTVQTFKHNLVTPDLKTHPCWLDL